MAEEPGNLGKPEPKPTPAAERPSVMPHAVRFVGYPKLLFIWPLILAGFIFWPLAAPQPADAIATADYAAGTEAGKTATAPTTATAAGQHAAPAARAAYLRTDRLETLGWIYIWIAIVVVMTLGVDIDRNQFIFWIVVTALIWVFGLWLKDVKSITIVGDIVRWFGRLDVQYNRALGLAISVLLSIPFVLLMAWAQINDRWRITHNEFEHFSFGRTDESLGRGAKTIRTTFPDVLEAMLGLAGTLIVYNASGTRELRRIPHVMFLPLVRQRLNKVLETTQVTPTGAADEEDEEEQL